MSDVVIRVENISKLYRLGEVGTGSLAHDVNRWWHRVRGKEDPYLKIGEVNDRTKPAKQASSEKSLTTEDTESTEVGVAGGARQAKLTVHSQILPQASLHRILKTHRPFAPRMPRTLQKQHLIQKPSTLDPRRSSLRRRRSRTGSTRSRMFRLR